MFPLLLIAAVILGAAGAALLSRNLIHSALLLVGAWAGIAAFYLWAGAEFVAFAQVLVYVGAVSMVVLFAVLLTRQGATRAPVEYDSLKRGVFALMVGGGALGILGGAIMGKDKSEGVIDKDNRVFGYENMYICDGSMISANPGVNPSLSITAISERAMSKIPNKN